MIDNSLFITIDKLKEELESYKEQCVGNHSNPEDCPTWHDWCNCGGFLTEHIQQLKEEMRELKKENIKLRSLNRRAAEEIRDLDEILIDCVENSKIPEYDEPEPMFAGFSSINLLNRLDGRANGGYVENYKDLHLEMETLVKAGNNP